mgnify:CR=1 FL=1
MPEIRNYKRDSFSLDYIVDFPADFDKSKKYPLLFYIHGHGSVGKSMEYFTQNCAVRREFIGEGLPLILVAPKGDWNCWIEVFQDLMAFMDFMRNLEYIDQNRVYLSGTSMGGYTGWMLAFARNDWFAAGVICCGGGLYWGARFMTGFPIMAVHGALDTTVLPRESEIMAERINAAGGNVQLVLHPDLAHNVWTRTFSNPETYRWLLSHSR